MFMPKHPCHPPKSCVQAHSLAISRGTVSFLSLALFESLSQQHTGQVLPPFATLHHKMNLGFHRPCNPALYIEQAVSKTCVIVKISSVQLGKYPLANTCLAFDRRTSSPTSNMEAGSLFVTFCGPFLSCFSHSSCSTSSFTSLGAMPIDLCTDALYALINSGNTSTHL